MIQEKILAAHVKRDPLPRERIDEIKAEILEEVAEMNPPSRRGKGMGLGSSSSRAVDSADDLQALDVEHTSMKDLIAQINALNESVPKRL